MGLMKEIDRGTPAREGALVSLWIDGEGRPVALRRGGDQGREVHGLDVAHA